MNRIQEIPLSTDNWHPGETLHGGEGWTHVVISYDIAGERYKIDKLINNAVGNVSLGLQKIDNVNTVLYWQNRFHGSNPTILLSNIRKELKALLKTIFIDEDDLSDTDVDVFCLVGNVRALAFKIQA